MLTHRFRSSFEITATADTTGAIVEHHVQENRTRKKLIKFQLERSWRKRRKASVKVALYMLFMMFSFLWHKKIRLKKLFVSRECMKTKNSNKVALSALPFSMRTVS